MFFSFSFLVCSLLVAFSFDRSLIIPSDCCVVWCCCVCRRWPEKAQLLRGPCCCRTRTILVSLFPASVCMCVCLCVCICWCWRMPPESHVISLRCAALCCVVCCCSLVRQA